jgi:hypothetical protein
MKRVWIKYTFFSPAIHVGERLQGNIFKPCSDYLRSTTITYALRYHLGVKNLIAVGKKIKGNKKIINRNPLSKSLNVIRTEGSRGPINIEIIENAETFVYVYSVDVKIPEKIELKVGGFKSLGLGYSILEKIEEIDLTNINPQPIQIDTYIPLTKEFQDTLDIRNFIFPLFSYVFIPETMLNGKYIKALAPGSKIVTRSKFLEKE